MNYREDFDIDDFDDSDTWAQTEPVFPLTGISFEGQQIYRNIQGEICDKEGQILSCYAF